MSRDDDRDFDNRHGEEEDHHRDDRDDGEGVRRRRPRKKKSSTGKVLLIVGGAVCLVVLVCGGIIGFGVYKALPLIKGATQATVKAEQFLNYLKDNKIDSAYSLTSKEFRTNFDPEQFADYVKKNDILSKNTSRSVNAANFVQAQDKPQMMINMSLHSPTGIKVCTMTLIEEKDEWKINSLSIN